MAIFTVGINHESAPVVLREKVAILPDQAEDALRHACQQAALDEVLILSTCNRTEIVGVADDAAAAERSLSWLAAWSRLPLSDIAACSYRLDDDTALRHLMSVASGLDSMVLGEPQILGQMKSAFATARNAGTVGALLGRLLPHVFSVAKRVRTDTAIGENPVSVAYAAVRLASRIYADLRDTTALLIGAGETIELAARHLHDNGIRRIVVANRTLARAQALAQPFQGEAILLTEIPERLAQADIVISSTASPLPILGKGAVERALKKRRHKPMLLIDIAVPRDIEPEVGELRDVYLYSVDDLQAIVQENLRARQQAARDADAIISSGVADFARLQRSLGHVDTLKAFREQAEQTRNDETERALRALARGDDPQQVLQALAQSLTNKLIHPPSVAIRRAAEQDDRRQIAWLRQLYGLDGQADESELS